MLSSSYSYFLMGRNLYKNLCSLRKHYKYWNSFKKMKKISTSCWVAGIVKNPLEISNV